jgi:ABC-2 type transport system ATP-binding protein
VTAALVIRHLIANLAARGKAILYTSHILDVVEKLCTRVIVLHEGCVVADDSVKQLRTVLASNSLEQVFAHLVLRQDPERTAGDIADVVTAGA